MAALQTQECEWLRCKHKSVIGCVANCGAGNGRGPHPEAQRADDDQRPAHDPLPPLPDELHVERQLVFEEHEHQAENNLPRVVAATPQGSHHRVLRAGRPHQRGQRGKVIWALDVRQCILHQELHH